MVGEKVTLSSDTYLSTYGQTRPQTLLRRTIKRKENEAIQVWAEKACRHEVHGAMASALSNMIDHRY